MLAALGFVAGDLAAGFETSGGGAAAAGVSVESSAALLLLPGGAVGFSAGTGVGMASVGCGVVAG